MKASDLKSLAEAVLATSGDIEVGIITDTPDGLFHFDLEPSAAVIEIPGDEYGKVPGVLVLAIGWEHALQVNDTAAEILNVPPPQPHKHLTLVKK